MFAIKIIIQKHANSIWPCEYYFSCPYAMNLNVEIKDMDKRFIGSLVSATLLPYLERVLYDLLTERTSAKGPQEGPSLQLEERRCSLIIRNMQMKNKKASI